MAKIEVVPYDPCWPETFETEKKLLESILVHIHHIGSTSVPGLSAKPKIDIIAVAKDRNKAMADLENVGYLYRGEWNIPLQGGFVKRENTNVNLHVFFDPDHPEIELNLKFRDYLRTHHSARDEYAAIKREILEDESSQEKINGFPLYTIRKRDFIESVIKAIGYNRLRILKCISEKESNFIKNFQNDHEYFILYRGVDIIGYVSTFNGAICESHAPDEESSEYLLGIMRKWINSSCG
ncbi:MAG: GrpB family protein [Puniceicoccales bacterium]|jgi:GrpB-like predicted nucleotidyltransferase (UPF0157 family)|nr:GrpB family protein [Puniceicoccales bacterium]